VSEIEPSGQTFTPDTAEHRDRMRRRMPWVLGLIAVLFVIFGGTPAAIGGVIAGLIVLLWARRSVRRTSPTIDGEGVTYRTWSGEDRWLLSDVGSVVFAGELPGPVLLVTSAAGERLLKLTRPWQRRELWAIAAALPQVRRENIDEPLTMAQLRDRYPAA
jgi:hypothetical protein